MFNPTDWQRSEGLITPQVGEALGKLALSYSDDAEGNWYQRLCRTNGNIYLNDTRTHLPSQLSHFQEFLLQIHSLVCEMTSVQLSTVRCSTLLWQNIGKNIMCCQRYVTIHGNWLHKCHSNIE